MDNELYFLLSKTQQKLFRLIDQESLARLEVSATQVTALMHLQKQNGCLQTELGHALGLGKAATSGIVSRLEKNGLVKRIPSPVDGRGQRVLITAEGLQVTMKARPLFKDVNQLLEQGFTQQEIKTVHRYLKTVKEMI